MKESLAKSLFKRLGGKIAQSVRQPSREVWIVRKPKLRATLVNKLKRAAPVVARQKNSWKAFRMACELMVSRVSGSSRQVLN
jgi:intergrase/recombinase